ncbi:MAG: hypothetical protein ACKOAH_24280, partial [Pirellula sp.]
MQQATGLSETALGLYRQMATGVQAGSEAWFEARARTVQVLEAMGEMAKAKELRELVLASYPSLSPEWKSRLTGS